MAYFPMFVDLCGKNVLIIGGGRIALQRAKKLSLFGANLTVVSSSFSKQYFDAFSELSCVTMLCENFSEAHLEKLCPCLVAVCPDEQTGLSPKEIYELCLSKKIPVNVADVPGLCTFVFPAVTTKGNISIGVSSSGCVPTAAAVLKERIDSVIPQNIDKIIEHLSTFRKDLYKTVSDPQLRKKILRTVTELCFERDGMLSDCELEDIFKNSL